MLRREFQLFCLALGFLTRVPVPADPDFSAEKLSKSTRYFPAVGGCVAILMIVSAWLLLAFLPSSVAAVGVMLVALRFTGAFHEDGLADSIDGLGGGWTQQDILRIMKDSRLGSYGAIALTMALFLKALLLHHLFDENFYTASIAILIAQTLSRLAPLWIMASLPYLGAQLNSKSRDITAQLGVSDLAIAHLFVLLALFPASLVQALCAMGVSLLVTLSWRGTLKKRLGGYTGDNLGAAQQFVELGCYLCAIAL